MIECIFTIDYEIYGNGQGFLKELVYEPAEKLMAIFRKYQTRFVVFVEVSELEMLESKGTDTAIDQVKHQIRDLYEDGFELGLHLHPQWYNARHEDGTWFLDETVNKSESYLTGVRDNKNISQSPPEITKINFMYEQIEAYVKIG